MEIEFNEYIGIFTQAAPDDYCDRMIQKFEDIFATNVSKITPGENSYNGAINRKDYSAFFESDAPELARETNALLDKCLNEYSNNYIGLKKIACYSYQCKVQKTPPMGGYHIWHCEQDAIYNAKRCLVWTVYLNDIPDGEGETEFLHQKFRLKPKKGTICLFPASWTHFHRGNLVMTQDKYIATGWYELNGN